MTYTIRESKLTDLKQIQQIAKLSWNDTYEGIIPRDIQDSFIQSAYSDEMMARRIANSLLLIAETEEKVIGFANFSHVRDLGKVELAAIYLHPECKGHGIGTALLNKGIEILEGAKEIYINVENDNEIGKSFYQAKKFDVIEEFEENFEGHMLQTIRMVLKL